MNILLVDLSGTLFKAKNETIANYRYALARSIFNTKEVLDKMENIVESLIGVPIPNTFAILFYDKDNYQALEEDQQKIICGAVKDFNFARENLNVGKITPQDSQFNMLRQIEGWDLYIMTARSHHIGKKNVQNLSDLYPDFQRVKLEGVFGVTTEGEPKVTTCANALSVIGADPETDNVVIIGDRASDMEALFRNGGKYGIFAKYGHGNERDLAKVEELRAQGMDIKILDSVYDAKFLNECLAQAVKN